MLDSAEPTLSHVAFIAYAFALYALPVTTDPAPLSVAGEPETNTVPPVVCAVSSSKNTRYWVIALPPLSAGAVNVTLSAFSPVFVSTPIVGAPGASVAVMAFDADDAGLVPIAFVAVTVNVYDAPRVRPGTVIGENEPVLKNPPGDAVTR